MLNEIPTELNIDKVCRSCMSQNEIMLNVFESRHEYGTESTYLADMLMACTSLSVQFGDGLPFLMCSPCVSKLHLSYEFKRQCQKSDSTLRQLTSGIKEEYDIIVQPDLNCFSHESNDDNDDDDDIIDSGNDIKLETNESSSRSHTIRPSFPCRLCHKVLRSKRDLSIHQRRHTGDKLRTCHICHSTYTRTHHLVRHMKTHMDSDGNYVCPECKRTYPKAADLVEHINDVHPKSPDNDEDNVSAEGSTAPTMKSSTAVGSGGDADSDGAEYLTDPTQSVKKGKGHFPCKVCAKVMTTFVGLKIHMRRHTGFDLSECKFCDKSFTKRSHLKRHLLTHGVHEMEQLTPPEKKVMECEFCDRKFKYRKSFNHHMETEHGMSEECDGVFNAKDDKATNESDAPENLDADKSKSTEAIPENSNFKQYESNVEPQGSIEDSQTNTECTNDSQMEITSTTNICHKCDKCDKTFTSPELLTQHVQDDHINRPYVCITCNKPFKRGEHLIRHLKVHENNSQTSTDGTVNVQPTCSVCGKSFQRSDHLVRHLKLHLSQDKRHICTQCGKSFNRLDNLKTHQRIHTGIKDTSKLHLCIYCGKEFNNSSNMIVHMRRHTGERPYKCNHCDKGFPRSHDLKCHERTHSGEKPYLCSMCGKSFNKSNKLLRHTRVHTGERPYVCNLCGRAFTQSNDLALHMRRHTGARPYACGMCPARFIQSGQLKAHKRTTGHWIDTEPDLKGGYRVEPVQTVIEMPPVRFKCRKYDRSKRSDDIDNDDNVDISIPDVKVTATSLTTPTTSNSVPNRPVLTAANSTLLFDAAKVADLQQLGLMTNEPSILSVKSETAPSNGSVQSNSIEPMMITFQSNDNSTLNNAYSTTSSNSTYNYQNFT